MSGELKSVAEGAVQGDVGMLVTRRPRCCQGKEIRQASMMALHILFPKQKMFKSPTALPSSTTSWGEKFHFSFSIWCGEDADDRIHGTFIDYTFASVPLPKIVGHKRL